MNISEKKAFKARRRTPSGSRELRVVIFLGLLCLAVFTPENLRGIVHETLAEAYIAVSTFVAFTLFLFYSIEHFLKLDTNYLLEKYERFQVPIAALMGALPGCGGAIIVITQYVTGRLGFGAVVAVLTSTMGDAAFLLLAQEPVTVLKIYAICLTVGTLSGYFVTFIHGKDFLKHKVDTKPHFLHTFEPDPHLWLLHTPWLLFMIPGLALGIGNALQIDTNEWFGTLAEYDPTTWIGMLGALLCVGIWTTAKNAGPSLTNLSGKLTETHGFKIHLERVMIDTNFVTVWVIVAFLAYELAMHFSGFDLAGFFAVWAPLTPLIAVLIGFVPGCGPQIVVTTLYLTGIVPFSAQIGNAISNDGDALFPAIALAPRAAVLATAYTAVPALITAYGYYFLFEL